MSDPACYDVEAARRTLQTTANGEPWIRDQLYNALHALAATYRALDALRDHESTHDNPISFCSGCREVIRQVLTPAARGTP